VDQHGEQVVQPWNDHRPYLVDLAFRMLGDIGAAQDVVQDAFTRLLRAAPGEIADERGWLIVVTSRLCLDQIRVRGPADLRQPVGLGIRQFLRLKLADD
jgi:RNA polymerase sigma-70 factor, ECF subfamily